MAGSLDTLVASAGSKVQVEDWLTSHYFGAWSLLVENSLLGTLSADAGRVYAVDDLAVPPPAAHIQLIEEKVPRYFGPLRQAVYHNRLQAYELDTGNLVWQVAGADKHDVHTRHGGDLAGVLDSLGLLRHGDDHGLPIGVLEIIARGHAHPEVVVAV